MKKILLVAAVAGLSLVSCKKDYTCECTTTQNGTVVASSSYTAKLKKKDAESWCSGNATSTGGGSTITSSCKLK
jgi:hypothetical protein